MSLCRHSHAVSAIDLTSPPPRLPPPPLPPLQGMDELSTVANEMVRLIETATAPILAVDANGAINGWNAKVSELTGLPVAEAMGRSLVRDLVHDESKEVVERVLLLALNGE